MTSLHTYADLPWFQPYPDQLLDEVAPSDEEPDAVVIKRETIELAFLAAMQVLPPRQRAALIARDVLGWPAAETATLLETSVAATNSALQRARATMQEHLPARRADWSAGEPSDEERDLLAKFIEAHERGDAALAIAISSEDLRITMPPASMSYRGDRIDRPAASRAPARRRVAPGPDARQSHADRGELPAAAGRHRVPRVQVRCPAHRGRTDRRDHDIRRRALPGIRAGPDPPGLDEFAAQLLEGSFQRAPEGSSRLARERGLVSHGVVQR